MHLRHKNSLFTLIYNSALFISVYVNTNFCPVKAVT